MDKLMKVLTGVLILCLLGYIAFAYVKNMPQATVENKEVVAEINAAALNRAFTNNEKAAEKKYLGKAVVIKGIIGEKYEDETGAPVVIFNSKEEEPIALVTLEPDQKDKLKRYEEGKPIKIKAQCSGMLIEVTLNKGIIVQ